MSCSKKPKEKQQYSVSQLLIVALRRAVLGLAAWGVQQLHAGYAAADVALRFSLTAALPSLVSLPVVVRLVLGSVCLSVLAGVKVCPRWHMALRYHPLPHCRR